MSCASKLIKTKNPRIHASPIWKYQSLPKKKKDNATSVR